MKLRKLVVKTAIVVIVPITTGFTLYAQKSWDAPRAVTTYCSGCHGIDGNTQLPYFPKLAGIDPTYAEKKLDEFRDTKSPPVDELFQWTLKAVGVENKTGNITRNERINMEGVAHAISPELEKEAVLWYAKQPRSRGRSGNKRLIAKGRELFAKGAPSLKVLPCMTCHGPEAQGRGPAPRLAGQNAEYIESQLDKFRKGDRLHAPEMTMVTRDLDPEQAHAVAIYLQSK